MSKRPPIQQSRPGPGTTGLRRPGSAGTKSSKTNVTKPPTCPAAAEKLRQKKKEEPPQPPPKLYENPAFSIPLKKIQTNPLHADKDKQKAIRRNIPQGEDIKGIKNVLLGLKKSSDVTVAEFIGLVAPYTGDNGETLRAVLTEDMNSFRKMARKIYETMSQDVSDVLTNQHIQLREWEQERTTLYTEKMMRAINEIFSYAKNFDFQSYYEDKDRYLEFLFPVPKLIQADSDEAEMHRRQQAFHRLNWLRTEGDRLAKENERLHQRLKDLKKEQMEEIRLAEIRESEAEAQRDELEAQEAAMQKQLEELTDKVEETMIDTEAALRVVVDETNITAPVQKGKVAGAVKKRRIQKKPEWVSETAAEIEEKAIEENIIAESGQVEVDPDAVAGVIKRTRSKVSKTRIQRPTTPDRSTAPPKERSPFHFSPIKTPPSRAPPPKERSPFHFSPIKTPPSRAPPPKERSPFHFSPIKTPPEVRVQQPTSPFHYSPPKEPEPREHQQLHTTRLRTEKVTVRRKEETRSLLTPTGGEAGSVTPQASHILAPTGEDKTPSYQMVPGASTAAPARAGTLPPQRPKHRKFDDLGRSPNVVPQAGRRAQGPRDTWGGFGG